MYHAQDGHDVTLGCVKHSIWEAGKKGTTNAALGLGVYLGRLSYNPKLGLQSLKELVAETSNLFLVPLIGLADLAKRSVRDN